MIQPNEEFLAKLVSLVPEVRKVRLAHGKPRAYDIVVPEIDHRALEDVWGFPAPQTSVDVLNYVRRVGYKSEAFAEAMRKFKDIDECCKYSHELGMTGEMYYQEYLTKDALRQISHCQQYIRTHEPGTILLSKLSAVVECASLLDAKFNHDLIALFPEFKGLIVDIISGKRLAHESIIRRGTKIELLAILTEYVYKEIVTAELYESVSIAAKNRIHSSSAIDLRTIFVNPVLEDIYGNPIDEYGNPVYETYEEEFLI